MSLLTDWKGHIEKYIGLWIMEDGPTPEGSMQNNIRQKVFSKSNLSHDQSKSHTTLIELHFVTKLCKYLRELSELNASKL